MFGCVQLVQVTAFVAVGSCTLARMMARKSEPLQPMPDGAALTLGLTAAYVAPVSTPFRAAAAYADRAALPLGLIAAYAAPVSIRMGRVSSDLAKLLRRRGSARAVMPPT